MRDNSRLWATVVVWTALTIMFGIVGALLYVSNDVDVWGGILVLIIVGILIESAVKATQAIWGAAEPEEDAARSLAKAKRTRQDRIERLVESLDDDEIYDLEALLLAQHEGQRGRS